MDNEGKEMEKKIFETTVRLKIVGIVVKLVAWQDRSLMHVVNFMQNLQKGKQNKPCSSNLPTFQMGNKTNNKRFAYSY
uniref:Uncharacterized protein n=1 Tax=Cucumis melo TaxID=3656 RepID=A0A9I9EDE6_CUCME